MRLWRLFEKTIEYAFYALFFFTPIIFNPSRNLLSFELFEWNKMMFVYFMTTIIVGAWIGKMILQGKIAIKRTPFDIPLLFFLASQVISTLFSIDRHVSIFGYYSRFHGGLISTISYALLYFAFVSNLDFLKLKKLLLFTLSSGTIVAIYGILEKFGIDAHMWVQDVQARVFSTLGQPNWLAAYLAVLIPILTGVTISNIKYKTENIQIKNKIYTFSFLLLTSYIFYICLLFTKSRSGFLGFWLANVVFWTVLLWIERRQTKNFLRIFLLFNISYLIFNFVFRTPFPQYNRLATTDVFNKSASWQIEETQPPVGDSVINVGVTDSGAIRRVVWKGALDIAKDFPLFGTGPETFAFAYYKYRPAEHNLTSEWDFLYNRAHNEFLNIAATSGYFGLASYLLFIVALLVWSFKQIKKVGQDKGKLYLTSAFLSAFTSILVTNFFGFSVVVIGLFFFLIPAFIYTLNLIEHTAPLPHFSDAKVLPSQKLSLGLLLFFGIFIIFTLVKLWIADSFYAQALSLKRQEQFEPAKKEIIKALTLRPGEPVYHDERAEIASELAALDWGQGQATPAATHIAEAIRESQLALKTSPQNVNFWKTRTRIFFLLSTVEPSFTQNALESILVAQELAPTDAKVSYNVAVIYGRAGKNKEAIETLKKTIELKPDYRDPYMALALFYEEEKQLDLARETLSFVLTRINPNDEEVKKRLEELK